jgi:hypothetical protein
VRSRSNNKHTAQASTNAHPNSRQTVQDSCYVTTKDGGTR